MFSLRGGKIGFCGMFWFVGLMGWAVRLWDEFDVMAKGRVMSLAVRLRGLSGVCRYGSQGSDEFAVMARYGCGGPGGLGVMAVGGLVALLSRDPWSREDSSVTRVLWHWLPEQPKRVTRVLFFAAIRVHCLMQCKPWVPRESNPHTFFSAVTRTHNHRLRFLSFTRITLGKKRGGADGLQGGGACTSYAKRHPMMHHLPPPGGIVL